MPPLAASAPTSRTRSGRTDRGAWGGGGSVAAVSHVNPVAAGGFSAAAGHYARARPTYARPAVGLLKESIPAGAVLDLAAGTGILTGQLFRAGRAVVAVEPLGEMLAQLRLSLPAVPCLQAAAEALPFADGSFAGVTVAQAFHWFDAPSALAEIARVLEPGGVLAMVWNVRDESVPWVRELTDLVHVRSGGRPYDDHREQPWEDVVAASGWYAPVAVARFANPVASSPALVAARVRSTSFVAMMDDAERESLLAEVADLVGSADGIAGRDHFDYPHDTVVYLCPTPT